VPSSNHSIISAVDQIRLGRADVMIAGGTEEAVCPIGIAGFAAMRAISTRNDDPERASRPFDKDRDGFVLGEGAGVLILESLSHAKKRGAKILARIAGVGMSADAHHISAPREDGLGGKTSY
jgi:3-oxoacyl-[acyl-carrier-protein] synthase II